MTMQKGIIKLKSTIGDITFYKTEDGHLAREEVGMEEGGFFCRRPTGKAYWNKGNDQRETACLPSSFF